MAYSCGARSEGMDTFGRTSYFFRGISLGLAMGSGGGSCGGRSRELLLPAGVVTSLDNMDNGVLFLAMGSGGGSCNAMSRELSLSTGVVALLDKVDSGDDTSDLSDRTDMDDP